MLDECVKNLYKDALINRLYRVADENGIYLTDREIEDMAEEMCKEHFDQSMLSNHLMKRCNP